MCEVGVIDTGVLIGFTIKKDQHHETTKDYIIDGGPDTIYLPPRAREEYAEIEEYIRTQFKLEIAEHRHNVTSQFDSDTVTRNGFQYIRDQILDEEQQKRAHAFLYRWYTDFYKQNVSLDISTVERLLSNMEMEVMEDCSTEYGGWESFISRWTLGVEDYPTLKSNLLLSDQPDLDILLEAHHIARRQNPTKVEFGTANPQDFKYHQDGEPMSREENILILTELEAVKDLSNPLKRHFPDS